MKTDFLTRYTSSIIDLKATGATTIFTGESSSEYFIPLIATENIISATALSVGATVTIGTNDPDYNNLVGANVLGISAQRVSNQHIVGLVTSVAAGVAVKVNVTVAVTGTSGTFAVTLIGFYA